MKMNIYASHTIYMLHTHTHSHILKHTHKKYLYCYYNCKKHVSNLLLKNKHTMPTQVYHFLLVLFESDQQFDSIRQYDNLTVSTVTK